MRTGRSYSNLEHIEYADKCYFFSLKALIRIYRANMGDLFKSDLYHTINPKIFLNIYDLGKNSPAPFGKGGFGVTLAFLSSGFCFEKPLAQVIWISSVPVTALTGFKMVCPIVFLITIVFQNQYIGNFFYAPKEQFCIFHGIVEIATQYDIQRLHLRLYHLHPWSAIFPMQPLESVWAEKSGPPCFQTNRNCSSG